MENEIVAEIEARIERLIEADRRYTSCSIREHGREEYSSRRDERAEIWNGLTEYIHEKLVRPRDYLESLQGNETVPAIVRSDAERVLGAAAQQ